MEGIFVGWLVEVDAYFSASGWWKPTYLYQVVNIVEAYLFMCRQKGQEQQVRQTITSFMTNVIKYVYGHAICLAAYV
jgi:hypothetical protein